MPCIKTKRACFIDKNNDLIQEFFFAHPRSIAEVNMIQNSHFYGSVLWNMNSKFAVKFEKSWNVSFRRMFELPMDTHCYLVEPVSEQTHARTLMAKRFLNFTQALRTSKKSSLRNLLKVVEFDCRSVTGYNLRTILLKSSADSIQELKPHHVTAQYRDIPECEEFRVGFIREIIEVKNNKLEVTGFEDDELEDILQHLCVS